MTVNHEASVPLPQPVYHDFSVVVESSFGEFGASYREGSTSFNFVDGSYPVEDIDYMIELLQAVKEVVQ